MKFRKKPVVIEAFQWNGHHVEGFEKEVVQEKFDGGVSDVHYLLIPTLEGTMRANVGDWIITGVNGEKYPCKPDIFEKTYERVD